MEPIYMQSKKHNKKIILTGTPRSGKTTIINLLREK